MDPELEPTPDLTSDIEWMLQSNQAPREMLLETLVGEYYAFLYHLALAFLEDSKAAKKATYEAISTAVNNAYDYQGETSVKLWLVRHVLDSCEQLLARERRRGKLRQLIGGKPAEPHPRPPQSTLDEALWKVLDERDRMDRLVCSLSILHGWKDGEIGLALQCNPEEVESSLEATRQGLFEAMAGMDESRDAAARESHLRMILLRRWPTLEASNTEISDWSAQVSQYSRKALAHGQRSSYLRETIVIAAIILILAGLAWILNLDQGNPETNAPVQRTVVVTRVRIITQLVQFPPSTPTPTAHVAPTQTPTDVFYTARSGDTYPLVAKRLGVPAEELRQYNRIPLGALLVPGQRLVIPGKLTGDPPRATPVTQTNRPDPLKPPYDPVQVRERFALNSKLFNTIWFDAYMTDYGPKGYIGPPKVQRVQTWLSQPQALILVGLPGDMPAEVWLNQEAKLYFAQPGIGQPWFSPWEMSENQFSPLMKQANSLIQALLDGDREFLQGSRLNVIGRDLWMGIEALLVSQYSVNGTRQAVFWMDDRTGVVLRKTWFSEEGELTREVAVQDIAYDIDLPQEYFDPQLPWRGGYAIDYRGDPVPGTESGRLPTNGRDLLDYTPAPDDFDPGLSQLTFQYPPRFDPHNQSASIVSLFGDDYYLENIFFGNPWSVVCQRSPNGSRIAYVSDPTKKFDQDSMLHWFDLDDSPDYLHTLIDLFSVTQFAWAPDNRRLAAFGYTNSITTGSLVILDTENGTIETLLRVGAASSLVWSPDGDQIALIARFEPSSYNEHIVVMRTATKQVLYSQPIDIAHFARDWPLQSWGVEFPVNMGGLAECTRPPR